MKLMFKAIFLILLIAIANTKTHSDEIYKKAHDILKNLTHNEIIKMNPRVFIGIAEQDGSFDPEAFLKDYERANITDDHFKQSKEEIEHLKNIYPDLADIIEEHNKNYDNDEDDQLAKDLKNAFENLSDSEFEAFNTNVHSNLKRNLNESMLSKEMMEKYKMLKANPHPDNIMKFFQEENKKFDALIQQNLETEENENEINHKTRRRLKTAAYWAQTYTPTYDPWLVGPFSHPPGTPVPKPFDPTSWPKFKPELNYTIKNEKNPCWNWLDPMNMLNHFLVSWTILTKYASLYDTSKPWYVFESPYLYYQNRILKSMWYEQCEDGHYTSGWWIYNTTYYKTRLCDMKMPYPILRCSCDFGELMNIIPCCPDEYNCHHTPYRKFGYCFPSVESIQKGIYHPPSESTKFLENDYFHYNFPMTEDIIIKGWPPTTFYSTAILIRDTIKILGIPWWGDYQAPIPVPGM